MGCITSRLALCPMLLLHPKQRERATRLRMKMMMVVVVVVVVMMMMRKRRRRNMMMTRPIIVLQPGIEKKVPR